MQVSHDTSLLIIVRTLKPKKCNFNAPAIQKGFFYPKVLMFWVSINIYLLKFYQCCPFVELLRAQLQTIVVTLPICNALTSSTANYCCYVAHLQCSYELNCKLLLLRCPFAMLLRVQLQTVVVTLPICNALTSSTANCCCYVAHLQCSSELNWKLLL